MSKQINALKSEFDASDNPRYVEVQTALASKPSMLASILAHTSKAFSSHLSQDLAKSNRDKSTIELELKRAEKQYKKAITPIMEEAYTNYQKLSIEQKIDLLAYSEQIAQINDKIRHNAREQMRQALVKFRELNAKHVEETHKNITTLNNAPEVTLPAQNSKESAAAPTTKTLPESMLEPVATPPVDKPLINEIGLGSPAAFTLNLPFTHIPGLPALNQVLQKIDRSTNMDLGFTVKGMVDSIASSKGDIDLVYKLSYIGFGVMSSKANAQFAPIAIKLEDSQDQAKWGTNASIFTRIHSEKLGSKFSVNLNDSDAGLSYAHEGSYQQPSKKIISTATVGRYLGKDAVVIRIPSEYVPTLKRISDALPTREETKIILDHFDKVVPVNQAVEIAINIAENATKLGAHAMHKTQKLMNEIKNDSLNEIQQHTLLNRIFNNSHPSDQANQPSSETPQNLEYSR